MMWKELIGTIGAGTIFFLAGMECIPTAGIEAGKDFSIQKEVQTIQMQKKHESLPETIGEDLIIYQRPEKYTYENFLQDMKQMQRIYGTKFQAIKLCDTLDGRGVYDLVIGNPQGDNQILIFGAMHAREYITSQVVMRQFCSAIDALNGYGSDYQGITAQELLKNVTLHFIPMSNPDGISISQGGFETISDPVIREQDVAIARSVNHEQWKSNARGVDLNRNFDADWDEYIGATSPSAERYKGTCPGSERETKALIDLTKTCQFKRTISYHTCGALIYWYYKQKGDLLDESLRFARRIAEETGYYLDGDYEALDAAGYKDWAIYKMGIPSLTIEIGSENGHGIVNPVPIGRWESIWERNKNVVYATAYNLQYESGSTKKQRNR